MVSTLTTCGGSESLLDALSVYTGNQVRRRLHQGPRANALTLALSPAPFSPPSQVFINRALSGVNELNKRVSEGKPTAATADTRENPVVEGVLQTLTSSGMTDLIKDPKFVKLSNALNLTCILNRPEVSSAIEQKANESLAAAEGSPEGSNSIDVVTYWIEYGLLQDMAGFIGPKYVECGGNLRILLQFAQAFSYLVLANRDEPNRGSSANPALEKYNAYTPEELYTIFQCKTRGYT